jgi:hypothetical protein
MEEHIMPKLTMFFRRSDFDPAVVPYSGLRLNAFFERLKPELKVIVAAACSTEGDELLPAYVDIVFVELHHSSDGGPASFELETYSKPALKKKKKKKFGTAAEPSDAILALRNTLVTAIKSQWRSDLTGNVQDGFKHLENSLNGILRVKWDDPDGLHV